jgi:hypothetical protein
VPRYVLTTVTTQASTSDLTTLLNVLGDLDINDATAATRLYLRRLISQCSADFATFCNRTFGLQTYTVTISQDGRPGSGIFWNTRESIHLRAPLVSVTSVTEDGTVLVLNTDYVLDIENATIWRIDTDGNPRGWSREKIVIVYKAGWLLPGMVDAAAVALPADIEGKALRFIKVCYLERGRDTFVKSENVAGVGSLTYGSTPPEGNMPSDIIDFLEQNYRVPVVA